jgi:outer membrane protein assembly factor BamA
LNLSAGAAAKNTPLQEKFNLAGANGVAEFQDEYYRARGTLPVSWRRNGHLYKNEFAAVRGVSLISDDYINNNIWAASINFSFPNIFTYADISLLDFFNNAIFFDAGTVWTGKVRPINKAAKSAGVSIAFHNFYDLNYIFGLEKVNFDFPLWIEQPGSMKNKDEFRWLISFEFKLDRNLVF